MQNTIKRSYKYIPEPTAEQVTEIKRLRDLFMDDDRNLLHGGRIKKSDSQSLSRLYNHFFSSVDNHDWSKDVIEMELDNLKSDGFCKNNTNKNHWSISILLGWVIDLDSEIDAQFLYDCLERRPSYQRVIKFAYWV